MFDLNEVTMFVQVVRAGSFAEAARRLGIPPNTLSRRVQQLEASLDTRLMQRSTRKLTMTAAGQAFFDQCAPAVEGVLRAGHEIRDGSRSLAGAVRIAAPPGFIDLLGAEHVAAFLVAHPRVHLDFVISSANANLIAEGIDVAFRAGPVLNALPGSRQFLLHHFVLFAAPAYLARRGTPATLQDLVGHDCLTASGRTQRTLWRMQGPHGNEDVEVKGRFSANEPRGLLQGCIAGIGIALLPAMLTPAYVKSGQLVQILPDYRREASCFAVVFPSQQQIPQAVSAFVDHVLEHFDQIDGG